MVEVNTLIIVLLGLATASGTAMIISVKLAYGGRIADDPADAHRNGRDGLPDRCTHRRRDRSLDDAARLTWSPGHRIWT
jgi:hypothetical protein